MSGDAPFHFVKRTNATLSAMMPQVMGLGNTLCIGYRRIIT